MADRLELETVRAAYPLPATSPGRLRERGCGAFHETGSCGGPLRPADVQPAEITGQ